jgi:hypothetical protein
VYNPEKRTCDPAPIGTYTEEDNQDLRWKDCNIPAKVYLWAQYAVWAGTTVYEEEWEDPYFWKFTSSWTNINSCEYECAPWYFKYYSRSKYEWAAQIKLKSGTDNYNLSWNLCISAPVWTYTNWKEVLSWNVTLATVKTWRACTNRWYTLSYEDWQWKWVQKYAYYTSHGWTVDGCEWNCDETKWLIKWWVETVSWKTINTCTCWEWMHFDPNEKKCVSNMKVESCSGWSEIPENAIKWIDRVVKIWNASTKWWEVTYPANKNPAWVWQDTSAEWVGCAWSCPVWTVRNNNVCKVIVDSEWKCATTYNYNWIRLTNWLNGKSNLITETTFKSMSSAKFCERWTVSDIKYFNTSVNKAIWEWTWKCTNDGITVNCGTLQTRNAECEELVNWKNKERGCKLVDTSRAFQVAWIATGVQNLMSPTRNVKKWLEWNCLAQNDGNDIAHNSANNNNQVVCFTCETYYHRTYTSSTSKISNITAHHGSCTPDEYSISFDANSFKTIPYDSNRLWEEKYKGSNPNTVTSYNIDTNTITLWDASRVWYVFKWWTGWAKDKHEWQSTPTKSLKITLWSTWDRVFYANWEANTNTKYVVEHYIQNLDANANTVKNADSMNSYTLNSTQTFYDTSDSIITLANKKVAIVWFTYSYWRALNQNWEWTWDKRTSTTLLPDWTRVIKLYYTRNQYKLTYDHKTNCWTSANKEVMYYYDAVICDTSKESAQKTITSTPAWVFVGWNSDKTATSAWAWTCWKNEAWNSNRMPASSKTVYAIYSKKITWTFYSNSTSTAQATMEVTIYNCATEWTLPAAPAPTSLWYSWSALWWSTNSNTSTKTYNNTQAITVSNNTGFYAIYSRTITFKSWVWWWTSNTQTQYYYWATARAVTQAWTAPANNVWWNFDHWCNNSSSATCAAYNWTSTTITPAWNLSTLTFNARYSRTVTFYSGNSKSAVNTQTQYYNADWSTAVTQSATLPANSVWWSFIWWCNNDTSATCTVYNWTSTTVNPTYNKVPTFYGKFSRTTTLSFNWNWNTARPANGSVGSLTTTQYYNSNWWITTPSYKLPSNGYSRYCYTFNWWDLWSVWATYTSWTPAVSASPSKTANAQWKINSYTVTLNKWAWVSAVSWWWTYNCDASVTINSTLINDWYTWASWTWTPTTRKNSALQDVTIFSTTTKNYTFTMPDTSVNVTANAPDVTAPTWSITINSNATYTTSKTVTLNLSASDVRVWAWVSKMRFSCNNSTWSSWENYATSKSWTFGTSYWCNANEWSKTVYVQYQDAVWNTSTSYSDSIIQDTVAPSCTNSWDWTWTASNRTIYYGCSDATSWCKSWASWWSKTFSTTTSTSTIASYTIQDNAGNSTTCQARTASVYVDKTAPSCTNSWDWTWTASNRTIYYGCSDGQSWCSSSYNWWSKTFSTTTTTSTIPAYTIKDNVWNTTNCPARTANVYVDKTAPSCTNRWDSTSWTSGNRTIYYGCSDGDSWCATSEQSKTFNSTTSTSTIASYTIKDNVWNTTTCPARTASVYVDKTAPSCTNSWDGSSWTSGNRTIYYGCSDGQSWCNWSYSWWSKTFSSTTSTSTIASYTIKDNVWNTTTCPARTASVYVDKTAPSCTNSWDGSSWTSGNRTIYYGCSDGQSWCNWSYSGWSKTFSSTTSTSTIASYTIKDNVWNTTTCPARTAGVYVDKTAPSCWSWSYSPSLSTNTNSSVTATLSSSTDWASWIATAWWSCTISTYNTSCSVTIKDNVWWTTTCTSWKATNIKCYSDACWWTTPWSSCTSYSTSTPTWSCSTVVRTSKCQTNWTWDTNPYTYWSCSAWCWTVCWKSLTSWSSVTMYYSSSPTWSCSSQTRTCTNWSLSWSYWACSCSAWCWTVCWKALTSWSSVTCYYSSSPSCPTTCSNVSQTRTCTNWSVSWSYTNWSCSTSGQSCSSYGLSSCPSNCNCSSCQVYTASWWSCSAWSLKYKITSAKSGYHIDWNSCVANDCPAQWCCSKTSNWWKCTCYSDDNPYWLCSWVSKTVTCNNWTWSDTPYTNKYCYDWCQKPWWWWVRDEDSVTAYYSSSPTCPTTCSSVSKSNTCYDWSWESSFWSYTKSSCSPSSVSCSSTSYPLTSCPVVWTCSSCTSYTVSWNSCTKGTTRYNLTSCPSWYTIHSKWTSGAHCENEVECWTANGWTYSSAPSGSILCKNWSAWSVTTNTSTYTWTCTDSWDSSLKKDCSANRCSLRTCAYYWYSTSHTTDCYNTYYPSNWCWGTLTCYKNWCTNIFGAGYSCYNSLPTSYDYTPIIEGVGNWYCIKKSWACRRKTDWYCQSYSTSCSSTSLSTCNSTTCCTWDSTLS